jgi:SAM-dependent methyltransferase
MADQSQVQTWQRDDAGVNWQRSQSFRNAFLAAATERMLDAAGLQPGYRVLDVAAGTGDQSLLAVRRVGPSGYLLATDLSPSMLDAAAKAAAAAGLEQVHTQVADAQELDVEPRSFDAAICRLGLMFVPDKGRALAAIRRALKPGARFATVVWGSPEKNPALTVHLDVVEPRLGPDEHPAMRVALSMGKPGLLEVALAQAGFSDIAVHPISADRRHDSVAAAVEHMRIGPAAESVNMLPEGEREAAWQEIGRRMQAYMGRDGMHIPGELLVGVGTN